MCTNATDRQAITIDLFQMFRDYCEESCVGPSFLTWPIEMQRLSILSRRVKTFFILQRQLQLSLDPKEEMSSE